ncbi:hypothetical protein A2U01_0056151, partial [Trifolium medium]|nr:hypothetical protein [Trifolium medium]
RLHRAGVFDGLQVALFCVGFCCCCCCSTVLLLVRPPHNQIANVDFLLRAEVFGGLHRTGYFGGLQFVEICV